MSDLSLPADGLEAGLAAGFGAERSSVLAALERRSGAVARVALRDSGAERGAALTRIGDAAAPTPRGRANYQIHGELARGGMGVLLKGRDLDLGRDVALKVLRDDLAGRPEAVQRFVEEAQIGGQLQHPGIVPVYELGLMADERPYFAMKLVQGRTLAVELGERSAAGRRRLIDVFASVCQTMAYAHSRGVVHRDLKPSNVLIGAFGEVQVIDWGLAKVLAQGGVADEERQRRERGAAAPIETVRTGSHSDSSHSQAGSVMGTPAYMAPEQARGEIERIDERSDVFALGAILCEVLTGEPPYRGAGQATLLQARAAELGDARDRLAACDADRELIELCRACLEPAQSERPRSAEVLSQRVQAYLATLEERARRAEVRVAEERVRARSKLLLTAAAAGMLLVCGAVWFAWREDRAQQARDAEQAVGAALAEATLARGQQDWSAANGALERARARLEGSLAGAELRGQVAALATEVEREAQAEQARRTLERDNAEWRVELDDVREPEGDTVYAPDWVEVERRFGVTFEARGVAVDDEDFERTLRTLAARGMTLEIASALDQWSNVRRRALDSAGAARLTRLADALDPDPLRRELRAALSARDAASLKAIAERARSEPLEPPTLALLANELRAESQAELAVELLRAGRRKHPQDFGLALELGRAARACKPPRANEALAHYHAALALRPQAVEVWHELGMTLYPLLGRPAEALALFQEALGRFPDDGHLHFHVGSALAELGRDTEALGSLQRALELEGDRALTWCDIGVCLDRLGRSQEALDAYERSIALEAGRAETHHNRGIALRKLGRNDEAVQCFERTLEIDPKFSRSYTELAYIHWSRGEHEQAIAAGKRACELDPKLAFNPLYVARSLNALGRQAEARGYFQKTVELAPDNVSARRTLVHLLLAAADESVRDAREGLAQARLLAERSPIDAELVGVALYAAGEYREARALFESFGAEGDDGTRVLFMALCDARLGDAAAARQALGALDLDELGGSMPLLARFAAEAREVLAGR